MWLWRCSILNLERLAHLAKARRTNVPQMSGTAPVLSKISFRRLDYKLHHVRRLHVSAPRSLVDTRDSLTGREAAEHKHLMKWESCNPNSNSWILSRLENQD